MHVSFSLEVDVQYCVSLCCFIIDCALVGQCTEIYNALQWQPLHPSWTCHQESSPTPHPPPAQFIRLVGGLGKIWEGRHAGSSVRVCACVRRMAVVWSEREVKRSPEMNAKKNLVFCIQPIPLSPSLASSLLSFSVSPAVPLSCCAVCQCDRALCQDYTETELLVFLCFLSPTPFPLATSSSGSGLHSPGMHSSHLTLFLQDVCICMIYM